jgi:hypothetical protein
MLETLTLLARPALLGGLALFFFGYLWYSVIFKNYFMKLCQEEGKLGTAPTPKQMAKTLSIQLVLNILTAASFTVVAYPIAPYRFTLIFTAIIWVGFTLPQIMYAYLWDNRSLKYTAFEIAYSLLSFVVLAGAVRLVINHLM